MDFKTAKETAKLWVSSDKTDFSLSSADENDSKLTFSQNDVSFYVVCPEKGSVKWSVWSDNESTLVHLNDIQEFTDTTKTKTLMEVLNRVNRDLKPLLGASAAEEEDNDDDVDDYIDDDYYEDDDIDAIDDKETKLSGSDDEGADNYFTGGGSTAAVHRLMQDLKNMKKADGKFNIRGSPRGDDLFIWDVQLLDFPTTTQIGQDIQNYARKYKREPCVQMEMKFPQEYPMAPPFVRVLRPRFKFLTGHITVGGSVCMEMLTRSGWIPTNDMESMLVQIRSEILSDSSTRLDSNPDRQYDEEEARSAFERMVQKYGWNKTS